jgi:hypothetical protein
LALVTTLPELHTFDNIDSLQPKSINFQQGMNKRSYETFLNTLPRNLHLDKDRSKEEAISKAIHDNVLRQQEFKGFGTIEEGDDEDFEEEADQGKAEDEGLTNAWQYKLSIQRERQGAPITKSANETKIFCHSYDLSGRMEEQFPPNWIFTDSRTQFLDCSCQCCPSLSCNATRSCANHLYQKCVKDIQDILKLNPNTVVRLLIINAPVKILTIAFPLIQHFIRSNSLPVVMMITVRPWLQTLSDQRVGSISLKQAIITLRRNCDAVFTCEGFAAMSSPPPPEFSDLAGILTIRKIALQSLSHFADSTTNRRPPANRYGMKRDRRKMHIRMLHLPPEDFSAGGSSVGSGARSGAGRSSDNSASNSSGDKTALQPGMGCATNIRSSSEAARSLEF